jgi:hypothetical protein
MEWHRNPRTQTWESTSAIWRARAIQLSAGREWYPYVERLVPPHDRHDGPHCIRAMDARAWCEAEIQRLEADSP